MKKFALLFLLFAFFQLKAHYGQKATFDFTREGNKLIIEMEFDKNHLLDNFGVNDLSEQKITTYILSHFKCKVNTIDKEVFINSIDSESHHVNVVAEITLDSKEQLVSRVFIWNTCLLEYHSEHTNTINFDLNDSYRSFQINQKRREITVDY